MTDPNDPDPTGQPWPDPPPPPAQDLSEIEAGARQRWAPPAAEEPDDTLDPPAPEGYLSSVYAQGTVQTFHEPAALDLDEIQRRYDERVEQARHRARTRQLQDIQNLAMTILIPLIGLISAVLLAGVARLVWSL